MTAQAATSLGVELGVLAADVDDSAAGATRGIVVGSTESREELEAFAAGRDVVTFDHELVPREHLLALEDAGHVLRPGADALRHGQDKGHQRRRLDELGLPVPAHRLAHGVEDVEAVAAEHGWPVVLKATRGGYDGRGVWVISDAGAGRAVLERAGAEGVELLAEEHVDLVRELAVLVARRPGGEAVTYPAIETVQRAGVLRELVVPARTGVGLAAEARELALQIAEEIDAVGILAVELFETGAGLLVNELALRPHNSGHFSIEGAVCSQFENHVRAVLDLPLGETAPTAPVAVTVNILGAGAEPARGLGDALAVPGAHVHLYGKAHRPGRKLGHVTVLGREVEEARGRAHRAAAALSGATIGAAA
jgi:5-(carboxyamino)imidazole ribonucleotide synthase